MKNNRYTNWFFAAAVVVAGFSMAACEDEPDKYEVAGGKPTFVSLILQRQTLC